VEKTEGSSDEKNSWWKETEKKIERRAKLLMLVATNRIEANQRNL